MSFRNKRILAAISLLFVSAFSYLYAAGVDRYALYIGSNKGGDGRAELQYAGSDAESIKKVMSEVGGITERNSILLIDPDQKTIDSAMQRITDLISRNKVSSTRTEFIFYYSGHSDEDALLLGTQRYGYSELKQAISEIPSDIHVAILDSCYSGNFIRTKGGQKKKPFLVDDSAVVTGHAYLSSSSETEFSQESDEIEASFFTNAVVTGLRGAADSSGDKKVTLNELYSYAFNETLKKTEDSRSGPQHPNYNITLVGSGDLILSDFSESDSIVSIGKDVVGKVVLRDGNGKLVSEIDKKDSIPIMLALPAGKYKVLLSNEDETLQGDVVINRDEAFVINKRNLHKIETKETTVRGNQVPSEPEKERPHSELAEDINDALVKIEKSVDKAKKEMNKQLGNLNPESININAQYKKKKQRKEETKEKKTESSEELFVSFGIKPLTSSLPCELLISITSYGYGQSFQNNLFRDVNGSFSDDVVVLDGSIKLSTFRFDHGSETLICGVNGFVGGAEGVGGYAFSPSIGLVHSANDVLKGIGLFWDPYIYVDYFGSEIDRSYWDWQSMFEVCGYGPIGNVMFSLFGRCLASYKYGFDIDVSEINLKFMCGIGVGFYLPSSHK